MPAEDVAAVADVAAEDFAAVAAAFLVEAEAAIHVAAMAEVATRAAVTAEAAIREAATEGVVIRVVTGVPARCSVVAGPAISPADLAEAIFLHLIFLEVTSPPGPPLGRGRAAVGGSHRVELSDRPPAPGPLVEQLNCLPEIEPQGARELVPPNNHRAVAQSPLAAKEVRGRPANRPSSLPKAQETFLVQPLVPAPVQLLGVRSQIGAVA